MSPTLPTDCFSLDWDAPTGAYPLLAPDGSPRELMCQMDVTGGGHSFCGKVIHGNDASYRIKLTANFGRSDDDFTGPELRHARAFKTSAGWLVYVVSVVRM